MAVAALLTGCGDDDGDDATADDPAEAVDDTGAAGEADAGAGEPDDRSGSGSGTLGVDGETIELVSFRCHLEGVSGSVGRLHAYGVPVTSIPASFPLQAHLGMVLDSPGPGVGTAALDVTPELHNPNGVVHGAVLFAMADTSMGAAAMSVVADGLACASIEVQLRFLRPVAAGRLTAETSVVRAGRRVVQLESRITNDDGELVATAAGSFAVIQLG